MQGYSVITAYLQDPPPTLSQRGDIRRVRSRKELHRQHARRRKSVRGRWRCQGNNVQAPGIALVPGIDRFDLSLLSVLNSRYVIVTTIGTRPQRTERPAPGDNGVLCQPDAGDEDDEVDPSEVTQ
jgi:hypothetical protein